MKRFVPTKVPPTQSRLLEIFVYNEMHGGLVRRSRARGRVRNAECGQRYQRIRVDAVLHREHQLVWLFHTGKWPSGPIDHINGNGIDNRIQNLRVVSHAVNLQNQRQAMSTSKTGLLGAHPHLGKFAAQIRFAGKTKHIGLFDTAEEAHQAYLLAKRMFHEGCTL